MSNEFKKLVGKVSSHSKWDGVWSFQSLAGYFYKNGNADNRIKISKLLGANMHYVKRVGRGQIQFIWDNIWRDMSDLPIDEVFLKLALKAKEGAPDKRFYSYDEMAEWVHEKKKIGRLIVARTISRAMAQGLVTMTDVSHVVFVWERIFPEPPRLTTEFPSHKDVLEALNFEKEESRKTSWKERLKIRNLRPIGLGVTDGFCYSAKIDSSDPADTPRFIEGVPVSVRFETGKRIKAELLSLDSLRMTVIVECPRPLNPQEVKEAVLRSNMEYILDAYGEFIRKYHSSAMLSRVLDPASLGGDADSPRPEIEDWKRPSLNPGQEDVLRACMTQPVVFVWGPPGTGKTYTLSTAILGLVEKGKRVLAVSISNAAIDEVARKCLALVGSKNSESISRKYLNEGRFLRLGFPRDSFEDLVGLFPHKSELAKILKSIADLDDRCKKSTDDQELARLKSEIKVLREKMKLVQRKFVDGASLVLTTSAQLVLSPIFQPDAESLWGDRISTEPFDVVVCDEASMMNLMHLYPAAYWTRQKAIISGDPKQLGPVVLSSAQKVRNTLYPSLFDWENKNGNKRVSRLFEQHRMDPAICNLISTEFYHGKLTTSPHRIRSEELPPLISSPGEGGNRTLLIDTGPTTTTRTVRRSRYNESEVDVLFRLLKFLETRGVDLKEVGIIAAYRDHASRVRNKWQQDYNCYIPCRVGTVHSFQGSEAKYIIWSLVDSRTIVSPTGEETKGKIGYPFCGEPAPKLVNVAISRAKEGLYIIGDVRFFAESRRIDRKFSSILCQMMQASPSLKANCLSP